MPWDVEPMSFALDVRPGEAINSAFLAENPPAAYMAGQAIPSMAPKNALNYFHKTECFCFEQQILAPGENAELGIQFIVDQDLPKAVKTITLSYTLFDVTDRLQDSIEQVKKAREENESVQQKPENDQEHEVDMPFDDDTANEPQLAGI